MHSLQTNRTIPHSLEPANLRSRSGSSGLCALKSLCLLSRKTRSCKCISECGVLARRRGVGSEETRCGAAGGRSGGNEFVDRGWVEAQSAGEG